MMTPNFKKQRQPGGFTLIELLVVVAIIAVLMAILMPSLGRAREQAKTTVCLTNAKQLAMGILMYADENQATLPYAFGKVTQGSDTIFWSWDSLIYRYVGGSMTDDKLLAPITNANGPVSPAPKALRCPSDVTIRPNYGVNAVRSYSMPGVATGGANSEINFQNSGIGIRGDTTPRRQLKVTMIGSPGDTVALAENHGEPYTSTSSVFNCAGNSAGTSIVRPVDAYPSILTKSINIESKIHNGRFVYSFLDGHADALRPREVSKNVSTSNSWANVGGKWVWNADSKTK